MDYLKNQSLKRFQAENHHRIKSVSENYISFLVIGQRSVVVVIRVAPGMVTRRKEDRKKRKASM